MSKPGHWWSVAALGAATLLIGLPYWAIPYERANLPSSLDDRALLAVGALALVLVALGAARFGRALVVTAGAVPLAIMLRVIVETVQDPTHHNLWPVELIIGTVVGLTFAVPGALVGLLIRRGRGKEHKARS